MIYLDILFFTNWMIDYLILVLVKKDFFPGTGNRRVAVGAFLAAGTYLLWFVRAVSAPEAIRGAAAICLVGMILWWTFSVRSLRQFLQAACAALGYTCLMGGACYALRRFPGSTVLPEGWTTAAGCAAVFLFSRSVGKRMKKEAVKQRECTYEVEIRRKDRTVFLQGMYDSGNRLESRWTGEGICVLSLKSAEGLLDEKEKEMLAFLVTQERFPWKIMTENLWSGITPISYSSVGKEDGWMPGITADRIIVKKDGKVLADRKGMLGITARQIFRDAAAAVLLPADIFSIRRG